MPRALRSVAAEQDPQEVANHIGRADRRPETAERIVDELVAKCNTYARTPLIGTQSDQFFEGCRVGRHKRWLIFYRLAGTDIEIVRILDGARDYSRLFD